MPTEIIHIRYEPPAMPPRKATPRLGVPRYLVFTVEDVALLLRVFQGEPIPFDDAARIFSRLELDTGGDLEQIAEHLQTTPTCVACNHEGMEARCEAIGVRFEGRRLRRLLERARGERPPGAIEKP